MAGGAAHAAGAAPSVAPHGAIVDIQASLCDPVAKIERGLDLRPRGAPFDVWLFDDPTLTLFSKGLRLRLRAAKGVAELTLKAAEQDCAALPSTAVPGGAGKCEYDLHGAKLAGALSLTHRLDTHAAGELMVGRLPLASALSPAQAGFLKTVPGAWPLPPDLRPLGPTRVRSYSTGNKRYVVDISELPGGERFVEISRKVVHDDVQRAQVLLAQDLAHAGVAACEDQSAQAVNKLRALVQRP